MAADEREILDWSTFGTASRELAETIAADRFRPDAIIAIARGGLPLAGALGYALDVKMLGSLNVEFYTGVESRLDEPVVLPPTLDRESLVGKRILLADDVADSGRTLALVLQLLEAGGGEVRTVCLYSKPGTVHEPFYVWKRTERWIMFPWSSAGPVAYPADALEEDAEGAA
ncbi:phosphoribosyltransferase [Protaetiibacter mangrovi]|uniref:Phosphoribosyltransferase n=2 Tax=Microbacteriaceae TaxID=85023 RepID=A0ABT1ZIV5_9MICO|nr:phosphoribosyltransferase [Protaetiibacter mangrovi]MCS0500651.1 phosphoribosyltransferase [Protaetiibacter mangrovi]TPX03260.1 phosphoribosyltransferase [Schumannella luteola]